MKKYILLLIIVVIIIGYFIASQTNLFQEGPKITLKAAVKAALGTKEDPQARLRYEYLRLRDPKTGNIPQKIRQKELKFASTLPVRESNYILTKSANPDKAAVVSTNWQLRGPYNVGGRTRALGIDITNENNIIAGGVSGGMWRSTNGGTTWTKKTEPDQLHSVTCLVQDTRSGHTNTWYFGTGEYRGNSASGDGDNAFYLGDGVFKSMDGGISWTHLTGLSDKSPESFDYAFEIIWNVAIDISNTVEDEVYAAAYGVIYRSVDGGSNWTPVLYAENPNDARYTDVAITSDGVVYATLGSGDVTKQGIWRSTNGMDWTNITPVGWPPSYKRIVLSIAPSHENIVYFLGDTEPYGTNNHSLWRYEYISGDGSGSGGSWTNLSANIPAEGGFNGNFDSQSSYDLLIKVKPNDENTVFIGGINLYRSTDGFATTSNTTWIGGYHPDNDSNANYPNQHADQHALIFYPSDNNKVIAGHDGGLSWTNDISASAVEWQLLNNGYYTTQFYTCAIDYSENADNIILGGMQDNGTYWVNNGDPETNWSDLFSGDGAYCAIGEGTNIKYFYVSAQNGQIYRLSSTNPVYNWAKVDPEGGQDYIFINPFVLDRNNSKIMYLAGGSVIWRNTDLTAIPIYNMNPTSVNWTELTNSSVASGDVSTLDVSTTPANRLYYGTSEGEVYRLDGANSGDPTPINITSATFPGGYISCVAVNPENSDEVIAAFSNYSIISLWHSSNAGASWQNISENLEQNPDGSGNGPSVCWAEILPTDLGTIYLVGTSTGLYSSINLNGPSTVWAQEGATTIGNVVVDMIDSRTTDDLVVVATHGNGMYSSNVLVSIKENPEYIVSDFQLKQNYPNPFNPSTTIKYQIPEATSVILKVFNIQGKEIATLVNSDHTPGNYSVSWNGQDRFGQPVASGTYIYQIKAGKHQASKQMVLMR